VTVLPFPSAARRAALLVTAACAAGVLLAGCGSSSSGPKSAGTAPPPPPSASTAAAPNSSTGSAAGNTVTATETEFNIALSKPSVPAGTYTFQVTNAGKIRHALTISGPGVKDMSSDNLMPGKTGAVTVALQPGSYDVYCPVDNHKAEGMDLQLTVT